MKRWVYTPSPLLNKTLREQLTSFPREPDIAVYGLRLVGILLERFILAAYFRLKIVGREKIPSQGPFILVANHSSHLDAAVISAIMRPTQWYHAYAAAAQDYFFRSFFRALAAIIFTNAMPFDRKAEPQKSLELCADVLQVSREAIIMFPEGTRSPDGSIQRFRPGVGKLVAGSDVPVIPAYIDGAHRAWPKGQAIPKPCHVTVFVGSPRSYTQIQPAQEGYISIASDLHDAVCQLQETAKTGP